MEKLEKTSEKVELKEDKDSLFEKPIYNGFRLLEDKIYMGYTSIRYWM